jgi:predicted  nucleic acid-binding Zn-ribbon protein
MEESNQVEILEKLNRTMDDLLTYKNIFIATTETLNEKVREIEKKVNDPKEQPKDIQLQIEKIEEAIEKITKDVKKSEKLSKEVGELFSGHEDVLNEITKERKTDLMYIQALDKHLKSVQEDVESKVKDAQGIASRLEKRVENTEAFTNALRNFIKAIVG